MRSTKDTTEFWKQETKRWGSVDKELLGVVASVLRDYIANEGIDFTHRSGAYKGTIDWSNYVARHLKAIDANCIKSFHALLTTNDAKVREERDDQWRTILNYQDLPESTYNRIEAGIKSLSHPHEPSV